MAAKNISTKKCVMVIFTTILPSYAELQVFGIGCDEVCFVWIRHGVTPSKQQESSW